MPQFEYAPTKPHVYDRVGAQNVPRKCILRGLSQVNRASISGPLNAWRARTRKVWSSNTYRAPQLAVLAGFEPLVCVWADAGQSVAPSSAQP
jgi:hypothetical protein